MKTCSSKLRNLAFTLRFVLTHPLNRDRKWPAICRYLGWQIGSRLVSGSVAVPFVGNTRLLVDKGMTGATGNIYTGLHEFEDMAFLLHLLRKEDLFVDIGANVGSYTVLAAGAVGAECISIEPVPSTFAHLVDNIHLNHINENVSLHNIGVGRETTRLRFSAACGPGNHVITEGETETEWVEVQVRRLDDVVGEGRPVLIKIDVEGFETEVLAGAENVLRNESLLAVIMELNGSGKRYGCDDETIHQSMLALGFKPFSYSPFQRELIETRSNAKHSDNVIYGRNPEEAIHRAKTAPQYAVLEQNV